MPPQDKPSPGRFHALLDHSATPSPIRTTEVMRRAERIVVVMRRFVSSQGMFSAGQPLEQFAYGHATDPSAAQIARHWAQGQADARVSLAVEPAESTALDDASVDLVAVAQALHWFDRYRFFATCERVLRPGGVLAAWTYQDIIFEDDLAEVAEKVRDDIDPYWPPERADVDMGYGDYVWPFEALPTPRLWLTADWDLPTLLGYFGSLSATGSYRAATGEDPVYAHTPALAEVWGDPQRVRTMRWPLILHLRRKAV